MNHSVRLVSRILVGLGLALLVHCGQTVTARLSLDGGSAATDVSSVGVDVSDVTDPQDSAGRLCVPMRTNLMIAPDLLFEGQPLGVTLRADARGPCGCHPELSVESMGPRRNLTMQRCNCCEQCACIAGGFEASVLLGTPAIGVVELIYSQPMSAIPVHTRLNAQGCRPASVTNIEIIRPSARAQHGALGLYWARITGIHRNCCMAKVGFVVRRVGDDFNLEPKSCDTAGCEVCMARVDENYTSDFLLGSLAPATYRVVAPDSVSEFTVAE